MAETPEPPPPQHSPDLGWYLALYPRLSRRSRRRMAALLVATALLAQTLAGYARGERASGPAGGNLRTQIAQRGPALPRQGSGGTPSANPAVSRVLRTLGLDAPAAPEAMASTPTGSQFQVNTYTTSFQRFPSVAMDADGDFLVAWHSVGSGGTDTSSESIQAQRYNTAGSAAGSQFQVNTHTTSFQVFPSVAMDADGDFVVAWESNGSSTGDTSGTSIQAQRYNLAGTPQGGQFQVNTYTTDRQRYPSVAMDADGDFVVVWESAGSSGSDTSNYSIQGQRYSAAGTPQGGEFQVNVYTTDRQRYPSVALDATGDFVVVWQSLGSSGSDGDLFGIQGRRYDSVGTALGSEFEVNTYTTNSQRLPSVAVDAAGSFVVVWASFGSAGGDGSNFSIQARRYDSAGAALGNQFQVNTYITGDQDRPQVARDMDGDFVVVWNSHGSSSGDTSSDSIQAQAYNEAGSAVGSQFQINTFTTSNQRYQSVAMDEDGDFLAVWDSYGSGGTDAGNTSIQAQRYLSDHPSTPTPTSTPPSAATPQPPTAVDLRSFRVIGLADRAILVWDTATEADTLGFQVLRAADAAGPWTPIGPALIPAEGGAAAGHTYVLRDAPGPGTWHYRLEDLGADGKRGAHVAAPVRVGPGAEGSAVFVPSVATGWTEEP